MQACAFVCVCALGMCVHVYGFMQACVFLCACVCVCTCMHALTMTLSATGSRNAPNTVEMPILRARNPSSQSVQAATMKIAAHRMGLYCHSISHAKMITGTNTCTITLEAGLRF
jgi:hypothetical protein